MTRKKQQAETPTQPEALDLEGVYAAEELNPALAKLYSEMGIEEGGQAKVYVHKLLDGGKESRVWEGSPDEYNLNVIAKQFGSGDYTVRIYIPNEAGRPVVRGNKTFSYTLPPGEDEKIAAIRNPKTSLPAAQNNQSGEFIAAIDRMMLGFTQAMTQIIERMTPKEKDPLTTLQGIKELAQVLVPPAQPHQGNSIVETLALVKSFQEVAKGFQPETPPDGEGGVGGVAARLMEKFLGKAIDTGQLNLPGVTPGAQATNDVPAATPQTTSTDEPQLTDEEQENMMLVRIMLGRTLRAAQSNMDFSTFAEGAYDDIPEELIGGLLAQPNWFEWIVQNEPRLKQYQGWLTQVRDKLIEFAREDGIVPPLTPAGEPRTVATDGSDNAGNVGGGKPAG